MTKHRLGQFGLVEREPWIVRAVPLICIVLILSTWIRFHFGSDWNFSIKEASAITLFAFGPLLLHLGRWLPSFVIGIMLWLFGVFSFAAISPNGDSPVLRLIGFSWLGEFSPNASVTIASLGLGLAVISRPYRRSFQTFVGCIASFLALAVAGVATWGHSDDIQTAYLWGRYAPLSGSGSFMLCIEAVLLLVIARSNENQHVRSSGRPFFISLGLGASVAATLMLAALTSDTSHRRMNALHRQINTTRKNLEILQAQLSTATLTALDRIRPSDKTGPQIEEDLLKRAFPFISSIQFIAPPELSSSTRKGDSALKPPADLVRDCFGEHPVALRVNQKAEGWVVQSIFITSEPSLCAVVTLDTHQFFQRVLQPGLEGTGSQVLYGGNEVVSFDYPNPDAGTEYLDLSFPLFGRPGWRISLAPTAQFDAQQDVAGVVRQPLLFIFAAIMVAWAMAVRHRAHASNELVRELRDTVMQANPHNERSALAVEAIHEPVVICNSDEQVIYANPSARSLLGFTDGSLQDVMLGNVVALSTLNEIRKVGFVTAREKGMWSIVGSVLSREVGELGMSVRIVAHNSYQQGGIYYVLVFEFLHLAGSDRTLRVTSSTPLWLFIDSAPISIWVADTTGQVEFASKKLLAELGLALEEFREQWPFGSCHPDDIEGLKAAGACIGATRRRLKKKDGHFYWVSETVTALKTREGKLSGYFGVIVDAEAEKNLAEHVRVLEEIAILISRVGSTSFWLHDTTRNVVSWASTEFEKLWGIRADELRLNPAVWREMVPEAVSVPTKLPREGVKLPYSMRRNDGKDIPVVHHLYPLSASNGAKVHHYVLHIVNPIGGEPAETTDSSDVQTTVRDLRSEVEHIYSFIARNVYEAARQIGTLGQVMVTENSEQLSATAREDAEQMRRESERLIACLRDFSDVTRVQRIETRGDGSSFSEAIERLQNLRSNVPPNISFSGDLGIQVPATREMLEIVVRSLASFVHDRTPSAIPRDIRILIKHQTNNFDIEFNLGHLAVGADDLSRSLLPGTREVQGVTISSSCAVINAVARRFNGKAWLSCSKRGDVIVHALLRGR